MEIGFRESEEFLPKFDKFQNKFSQRILFLKFFNNQVEKELRFNKKEILFSKKYNLCEIFKLKMLSLLDVSSVPFIKKVAPKYSNFQKLPKLFNPKLQIFLNKKNMPKTIQASTKNLSLAIKLFKMIDGTKLTYKIDANKSFKEFIFKRLLQEKKNRIIQNESNSINMILSENSDIKIFPYWNILEENKILINTHIKDAVNCIKNSSFKNIYLVYPKNRDFQKHIDIKIAEFETKKFSGYGIKLVPYSLRSILK